MMLPSLQTFYGGIMKALLILLCLLSIQVLEVSAYEVSQDSKYIYIKRNLAETSSADHQEIVAEQIEILKGKLSKSLKSLYLDTTLLDRLQINRDEIGGLITRMEEMSQEISTSSGIRLHDAIPNGFMIVGGAKVSGNYFVGIGGSMTLGLVFVPKRVDRINKITKASTHYYELDWSLIGWPSLDLGVGVGAGGRGRFGVGLIWGNLNKAADFSGFTVGLSASGTIGPVGGNIKAGLTDFELTSRNKFKYFFLLAQYDAGIAAEAEIHFAGAYIANATEVAKMLGYGTSTFGGTTITPVK